MGLWPFGQRKLRESLEAVYLLGKFKFGLSDGPDKDLLESDKFVAFAALAHELLKDEGRKSILKISRKNLRKLELAHEALFAENQAFSELMASVGNPERSLLREIRPHCEEIDRRNREKTAEGKRQYELTIRWLEEARIEISPGDLVEWLKDKSPADWHEIAFNYNTDHSLAPLVWIAQQPSCDRATAMCIFQKGSPIDFDRRAWNPDENEKVREISDLLDMIAQNLRSGFYTRQEFACDMSRWSYSFATQQERLAKGELVVWPLPEDAFGPFEGQPHESGYEYDSEDLRIRRDLWKPADHPS